MCCFTFLLLIQHKKKTEQNNQRIYVFFFLIFLLHFFWFFNLCLENAISSLNIFKVKITCKKKNNSFRTLNKLKTISFKHRQYKI